MEKNAPRIIWYWIHCVYNINTLNSRLRQKKDARETKAENKSPDQWEKSSTSSTPFVCLLLSEVLKVFSGFSHFFMWDQDKTKI